MRRAHQSILILIACLCLSAAAIARTEPMPRSVVLEHRLELPEGGDPLLRVDLRIPLEQLVFRRAAGGFVAELRTVLRAQRRGDGRVESALSNETVRRPDFLSSRAAKERFDGSLSLPLPPGKWQVEALVYRKGDATPWQRKFTLHVPEPGEGRLFLQGPRWRGAESEGLLSEPFSFRDPWELPESSARFVDGLDGAITMEVDVIFWEPPQGDAHLIMSLLDSQGRLSGYSQRELRPVKGPNTVAWELQAGRLSAGSYLAELELVSPDGSASIRGRLDVGLTRAAFGRDWKETCSLVRDIAEDDELEELEDAQEGGRVDAWQAFWQRRDPNGSAPGNQSREQFWLRFAEANARFGSSFQEGFRSDRGRIFLELGAPDKEETYQDDRNFRVLLYWHYNRLGRVYIFEDRHGYENFTLVRING